jgi:hypothetical protein
MAREKSTKRVDCARDDALIMKIVTDINRCRSGPNADQRSDAVGESFHYEYLLCSGFIDCPAIESSSGRHPVRITVPDNPTANPKLEENATDVSSSR